MLKTGSQKHSPVYNFIELYTELPSDLVEPQSLYKL